MKHIGNLLGLCVSLAALSWLATTHDFSDMLPHLRSADYASLAAVPLLLLANFVLRAARWRVLFPPGPAIPVGTLFSAMMIGNLFNNILPARGGEFVKIYLLGRTASLSKSRILATVIVEKAADLVIAIALLALLLAFYPVPGWARNAGLAVAVVALAAVSLIAFLGLGGPGIIGVILRALGFLPQRIRARIDASLQQFTQGLAGLVSVPRASRFLGASAAIWCLEISVMYAVARAFSIEAGPADLLFIMLMILFGTMVPSSPGYIGTFEFFGLSALGVIGVSGGGALGFVVVLHAVLLLGSSLLGILCLARQGWPRVRPAVLDPPGDSQA